MIAAMLMDQDAILRAIEVVDDTMFYREANRRLFRAMASIAERGDVVDPLTLTEELSRRGELQGAGGKGYMASSSMRCRPPRTSSTTRAS